MYLDLVALATVNRTQTRLQQLASVQIKMNLIVLRYLLLLLFSVCLAALTTADAQSLTEQQTLSDKSWPSLPPHPRLFATTARWDALKQQIETDDVSRKLFAVVRETALQLLDKPPVEYVDLGAYWHGPMRQSQGRILSLSMMFRLSGESRFLDRAKLEMQTLADLPNWYPQHFLDTAEGALGMAIGLDWLHDSLTQEERDHFAKALADNSLRASLQVAEKNTWVAGNNNWTAVCHGGLVIAALAVAEREPELAKVIVDRAIKHMPRYAELYAPAGAYSEGPDY